MEDPVILPSGYCCDRKNIKRHIGSSAKANDPFNRKPLTDEMLRPDLELKKQIGSDQPDGQQGREPKI
jgi:hypothetical protein